MTTTTTNYARTDHLETKGSEKLRSVEQSLTNRATYRVTSQQPSDQTNRPTKKQTDRLANRSDIPLLLLQTSDLF